MTGGLGGPVRFQARVSSALAWKVTVTDALGQQLAARHREGADRRLHLGRIARHRDGRHAGGSRSRAPRPCRARSGRRPSSSPARSRSPVSPPIRPRSARTATARRDSATITYSTNAPATVTATLLDAAGVQLGTLGTPAKLAAGEHSFTFDGLGQPDGVYTIVVTAVDAVGVSVIEPADDRDHANARRRRRSQPALLTPNGDGNGDALTVTFQLAAPATVRLRVLRDGKWVATPFTGPLPAGPQSIGWNGAKRVGKTLDGSYAAVIDATDAVGTATVSLPFLLDAHPPVVKLAARPVAALGLGGGDRDRPRQRRRSAASRPRGPATSRSPASAR